MSSVYDSGWKLHNDDENEMHTYDIGDLRHQFDIIKCLAEQYSSVSYIDIENDTYECIFASERIMQKISQFGCASVSFNNAIKSLGINNYAQVMREFTDLTTLSERLADVNVIFAEFFSDMTGWSRSSFIVAKRDENGKAIHALYTVQNISARKKAEIEEHSKWVKQYDITRGLADIYASCHYIDIATKQFVEISASDLVRQVIMPEGDVRSGFERMIEILVAKDFATGMREFIDMVTICDRLAERNSIDFEFIDSNNTWLRACFIVVKRSEFGRPTYILFTTQKIDVQKKRELQLIAELRESVEKADKATRAKSEFLSRMSHEIRTPINGILGMTEMIRRESSEKNVLEYAASVEDSGNALLSVINDILDFSKIESGKMEIAETEYNIADMIRNCYNLVRDRANKKGLELRVNCNENMPSVLYGDMHRISQIINNMLTNAIKYTDDGCVDMSVDVAAAEDNNSDVIQLKIVVKDTGIGMKDADKELLFTEFQRFELKRNQTIEGTGLGLAIVKHIVDLMKGTIAVESTYGEGSTFTVILPQKVVDNKSVGKIDFKHSYEALVERQKREKYKAKPGTRVLVVDDVDTNLKIFSLLLKNSGLEIDTAISGKEALSLAKCTKYDIIFMDHMMPEMNGIECMKAIQSQEDGLNKETPQIMLTANAVAGMREEYIKLGFADYLTKPVKSESLEAIFTKLL